MSGNYKKEDLRVQKTHKYLRTALETILDKKNFKHITVNDLCEEALVSRAAFYSHFKDKYDLLESWLDELAATLTELESITVLKLLLYDNRKKCKNIVKEADNETMSLIHKFAIKVLEPLFKKYATDKTGNEYIVLSSFCVGGALNFLYWQIEHSYPNNLSETTDYFDKLIGAVVEWDAKTRNTKYEE